MRSIIFQVTWLVPVLVMVNTDDVSLALLGHVFRAFLVRADLRSFFRHFRVWPEWRLSGASHYAELKSINSDLSQFLASFLKGKFTT